MKLVACKVLVGFGAYNVGDVAGFTEEVAEKLIEQNLVELYQPKEKTEKK